MNMLLAVLIVQLNGGLRSYLLLKMFSHKYKLALRRAFQTYQAMIGNHFRGKFEKGTSVHTIWFKKEESKKGYEPRLHTSST